MVSAVTAHPGRVLVTDGEFKHTLGIVRALAARGHEVHVIASSARAPAVHSKAVRAWHLAPASSAARYDERLLALALEFAPLSLIPVGNGAVAAVDRLRERLGPDVRFALPAREALATANDKAQTGALARTLGIATPEERVVQDLAGARAALAELGLPFVLKSAREEGRKVLRYVRGPDELAPAFEAVRAGSSGAVLAQRHVVGPGFGFSALYWRGERVRALVHRRVREWPPSGGTSACAESVPDAPEIERAGEALLGALAWHGVAMVEFKGDPARGTMVLMEINAKFWGSHDLALAASVDLPGDLVALLEGETLGPQPPVPKVRLSWPLGGDLWHGLFKPSSLPAVIGDALSPQVAHTFHAADPMPTVYEALQWLRSGPGAWREFRSAR